MKVVLFCGGLGMRIRECPEPVPKPMITIGYRPLMWHLMKYYAHHGHKDFILCLGYRADAVKNYFLNYNECVSNNFVLANGGKDLRLLNSDIQDWRITFVDTGLTSNIGQRLKAVQPYLEGEEMFLANYSDGLTNLPLPQYIEHFQVRDKVASFVSVRSPQSYHVVSFDGDVVTNVKPISKAGIWINGGFFVFKSQIFDYMRDGEELVEQPFQRLIEAGQLLAYKYEGYWGSMDTFKEKQHLEDLYSRGEAPWEVWKYGKPAHPAATNGSNGTNVRHKNGAPKQVVAHA
jgi:glucose-1-phosphate cytidylyltransferase